MAILRRRASLLYLNTALLAAEVDFINEDLEEAADQLSWLWALLVTPTMVAGDDEGEISGATLSVPVDSQLEIESLRDRVRSHLTKLSLNLDYWGRSHNFVPLVSHAFYDQQLAGFFAVAQDVEDAYLLYRDASNDEEKMRRAVNAGIDAQTELIQSIRQQIEKNNMLETSLVKELEALTVELEAMRIRVEDASGDFKAAVEAQAGGCSFGDLVKGIASIAIAVKTGGVGLKAALTSYNALRDHQSTDDEWKDFKFQIKQLSGIAKGFSSAQQQYNKIRDILNQPNPDTPNLPSDEAKIMMERDRLEEMMGEYRSLPEAQSYLRLIDEFVILVTTRNSKLVDYNALVLYRLNALADISAAEGEMGRLSESMVDRTRLQLPAFKSFMYRANLMNKREIVRLLVQEHRALEYWSGEETEFRLSRETILHLRNTHTRLKTALVAAMENQGRTPQRFRFEDGFGRFELSSLVDPGTLAHFKDGGQLIFNLPDERFRGLSLVKVDQVRISIPGLRASADGGGWNGAMLRLVHLGNADLTTLGGAVRSFSHDPRATVIFYLLDNEWSRAYSLGGSESFIKLTPFGTWRLDVNREEAVNLTGVTDIVLEFEGEFFDSH